MQCPHCGYTNPSGLASCAQCRKPLIGDIDVLRGAILGSMGDVRAARLLTILQTIIIILAVCNVGLFLWNQMYPTQIAVEICDSPAIPAPLPELPILSQMEMKIPDRVEVPMPKLIPQSPRTLGFRHHGPLRQELVRLRGGSIKTDQTINRALRYLSRQMTTSGGTQSGFIRAGGEDGPSQETAVTSLMLLAMLANGHHWLPSCTEVKDRSSYALCTKRAINWLIANQQPSGQYGPPGAPKGKNRYVMPQHGMATLAVLEALAMTGQENLRDSARKAVSFIIKNQLPNGAWHYLPKRTFGGETSMSGWQIMALVQASRMKFMVPDRVFAQALQWFDKCTAPGSGMVGDTERPDPRDKISRPPLGTTAIALMCRLAMGQSPGQEGNAKVARLLTRKQNLPSWPETWVDHETSGDKLDIYYLYHGTCALAAAGGPEWKLWHKHLSEALLPNTQPDGSTVFWPHIGRFHKFGGDAYSTALAVLALSAPYRYAGIQKQ